MRVVCIGDIGVGDRNAMFLHRRHIRERDCRGHAIKAREADVTSGILDDIAVEVS